MIEFIGESLPSAEQVIADSSPVPGSFSIKGVYFLLQGETVVYVGSSVSIYSRIETHIAEKQKVFDSYAILQCPSSTIEQITAFEAFYILKFQPQYNWGVPGNPDFISNKQIKVKYGVGALQAKKLIKQGVLKPFGEFQGFQYFLRGDLDKVFGGVA